MSEMGDFTRIRDWVLTGAVGILIAALGHEIHQLRVSVDSLNISVGILVEHNNYTEKRLDGQKARIDSLENRMMITEIKMANTRQR